MRGQNDGEGEADSSAALRNDIAKPPRCGRKGVFIAPRGLSNQLSALELWGAEEEAGHDGGLTVVGEEIALGKAAVAAEACERG